MWLVVHEGASGRVEDAMFLALRPCLGPESAGEAGLGQGLLPGLRVQVEHSALRSRGSACLAFVYQRTDAVPVQDSGQGQAAEAPPSPGSSSTAPTSTPRKPSTTT